MLFSIDVQFFLALKARKSFLSFSSRVGREHWWTGLFVLVCLGVVGWWFVVGGLVDALIGWFGWVRLIQIGPACSYISPLRGWKKDI